jgi:CxxC motif-containing protein
MERRELTCISCPIGCHLQVDMEDGKVVKVTGNTCKRGQVYGEKECTNPTRIVTSSVRVIGGKLDVVSIKTARDIPKGKIFDCVEALKGLEVNAPVKIGDIILENAAGTGVNIIATKNIGLRR